MTLPRVRPYQENLSLDSLIDKSLINIPESLFDNLQYVQYICHVVNSCITLPVVTPQTLKTRLRTINGYKEKLAKLLTRPKIEQRSPEWFALRSNLITASDFAQALGAGKFGNQKQFFKKKCGYEEESFSHYIPPLKWGCMFEQLATNIYEVRQNTKVHEFGILPHPTISYFGASPDGISEQGIMLEIKCPFMRKITGEIPQQYYYQIQGQLEVCDLDECDYLEVGFKEYSGDTEFDADLEHPHEQGIILEYTLKSEDNLIPHYEYSPILCYSQPDKDERMRYIHFADKEGRRMRQRELKEWVADTVNRLENMPDVHNGDIIYRYWKLDVYNVVRVYRDKEFTHAELQDLSHVWDKILKYKQDKDMYLTEVCCKRMTKAQQAANALLFAQEKDRNEEAMTSDEGTEGNENGGSENESDRKFAFEFLPEADD